MSLNSLAVDLSARCNRLGNMEDLDEAIVLYREALNLRPQGHPDRSMSLNNPANELSARYKQPGVIKDLDVAIALAGEALKACAQGHPARSKWLKYLVCHL